MKRYSKPEECIGLRVKRICYATLNQKLNRAKFFEDINDVCHSKWNLENNTQYYLWDPVNPFNKPLEVEIVESTPSYKLELMGYTVGKPVLYQINVETDTEKFVISRRYNHFFTLFEQLKKQGVKDLPPFPEKLMSGNTDPKNLEKRKELLGKVVEFLVVNQDLFKLNCVRQFCSLFYPKETNKEK